MNKRVVAIIIAVILAVVGFLYFTQPGEETATAEPSSHTFGKGGIVLIEYGDFQCPACGQYFPVVQQVKEKYQDHITFQFRHFPLESAHPNARAASRAAEAASIQGMFWEMHDYLFQNQTAWQGASDPLAIFEGYASAIGIPDTAKFADDMRSSAVNAIITADLNAGRDIKVTGTPTFVLDGTKLEAPSPTLEAFSAIIDQKIEEKTGQKPVFEDTVTEQTQQ